MCVFPLSLSIIRAAAVEGVTSDDVPTGSRGMLYICSITNRRQNVLDENFVLKRLGLKTMGY